MQREMHAEGRLLNYPAAHVFRPPRGPGAPIGAAAAVVGAGFGLALVIVGLLGRVSFAAFGEEVVGVLLLALGLLFGYWAYALYTLRYIVDDDALIIAWGLSRQLIPVDQIDRIVLGRKYGEPKVSGISWPGYHVGRARVARIGEVILYSAHRSPADLVYISTPEITYGLSLGDARGLARTVQAAQDMAGREEGLPSAVHRALPLQALLLDRPLLLLAGCAVLVFLVAAGYIFSRYQSLPLQLTLPYPVTRAKAGSRSALLRLPETAFLWLIIGLVLAAWAHTRLRISAYTVLAGTLFAECLYLVAALAAAH